jgi:hypothetical protein
LLSIFDFHKYISTNTNTNTIKETKDSTTTTTTAIITTPPPPLPPPPPVFQADLIKATLTSSHKNLVFIFIYFAALSKTSNDRMILE